MIEYFCGDAKRIQHLIKVHSFSKLIGEGENLDEHTMFILESSALVHDIGIKISEEKYGDSNGKHQELEGPAEAEKVLKNSIMPMRISAVFVILFLIITHMIILTQLTFKYLLKLIFL